MGGMGGGPMDFGKSKSRFQEIPETGVGFADVAVSASQLSAIPGVGLEKQHSSCT